MRTYIVNESGKESFKSLEEALAAVKRDKQTLQDKEPVRIIIKGMQHLQATIRLTAENLPGADHPVLIEGADEASGFSGGIPVKGFEHWKDNIWRVKIPQVTYTRHLYIDGNPAKRPATPYRPPYRWKSLRAEDFTFANLPGEEVGTYTVEGSHEAPENNYVYVTPEWTGIATTHTEIADWKNIRDLEMIFDVGWVHRIIPIEWVKPLPDGRLYIKPVEPAFRAARIMGGVQIGGCPNCIENVFELLGSPLEWYFDRTEQMLYVGFAEGDVPENHEIVIPLVEQLFEIKGETENKLCHLNFRNLKFEHTTWLFPQKYGMPEVQAGQMRFMDIPEELVQEKPYDGDYHKIIAAVRVLAACDVGFEGCTFTALGTGALQYEYGTQDCGINGNHFYKIGGSAVSLGDFYLERAHHPKDRREIVRNIRVTNNYIHHTGLDFRGTVAIIAGYVQDVTIAHNEIHDVSYTAISLGWGWGMSDVSVGPYRETLWQEPSVCMRNKIMNNHIKRCMMLLCDGGAIYTLGNMNGTVISGNYIHESAGYLGEGFAGVYIMGYNTEEVHDPAGDPFAALHGVPGGIYLDEGSIGIEVCDNVLHDVAVPLNYHNQVDEGYKKVCFRDNVLNKRPGEEGCPMDIIQCAGLEPAYRFLAEM